MSEELKKRVIGRWYIGETLGKGGYSWVKKGKDIKTNKTVALKFMEKADASWIKEQALQVETEIDSLKNIRHKNVMKLYAYNLNAQYPTKEKGKFIETILLVLEYAPGGELFDILYYTSKLEPIIARTYFRQIIAGLEACHNAQVVHRDLKPQNLLLDAKYNLKITDFGLSKVIKSDDDAFMKTSYVGTKGYQAPELLLKQKYDLKCDIFSTGVILFILLAGYPPFEQATKDDKWFKPLVKENSAKFWKAHEKSQAAKDPLAKDLLEKMLSFDAKKRISIDEIKNHEWYKKATLKQEDLIKHLRLKHRKAEEKRRLDVRKMKDLKNSINPHRHIDLGEAKLEFYPSNQAESVHGVYSFGNGKDWTDIYQAIEELIAEKSGVVTFNSETNQLNITMNVQGKGEIKFFVKIYQSLEYKDKNPKTEGDDDAFVYVIETRRVSGDFWTYNKIKSEIILKDCANFTKGLPKWAEKSELDKVDKVDDEKNDNDNNEEEDEEDDYFKLCETEFQK